MIIECRLVSRSRVFSSVFDEVRVNDLGPNGQARVSRAQHSLVSLSAPTRAHYLN